MDVFRGITGQPQRTSSLFPTSSCGTIKTISMEFGACMEHRRKRRKFAKYVENLETACDCSEVDLENTVLQRESLPTSMRIKSSLSYPFCSMTSLSLSKTTDLPTWKTSFISMTTLSLLPSILIHFILGYLPLLDLGPSFPLRKIWTSSSFLVKFNQDVGCALPLSFSSCKILQAILPYGFPKPFLRASLSL